MRGTPLSDQTRAAVVAALLMGQAVNAVAREYALSHTTVSSIKKSLPSERFVQVRRDREHHLDELLLDALAANLSAQKRILDTASDPQYIREQPAENIAQLFSAFADRAIRLLEAASAVLGEGSGVRGQGSEGSD